MSTTMRRYLDEDWDDEVEDAEQFKTERERKTAKSQLSQARRQASKEFGKNIAKMHRQRAKLEGGNCKP